ncbi:CcdB family protein [Vibrio sp. SCSIO 43136]|uniref:CcdB family protein n=1 Tax=Vibrio sp. SCSIO 43136 TaxID=2819101 RepID=UPI0020765CFA|nr:CcdB family protein [Vibrio sp. SCSIO 43136]USD64469.1 CcdB family protein [Vibrio sp. SCSIO 43136]
MLLDLQTDLLDGLTTRVVVPLLEYDSSPKPANTLNPIFEVEGKQIVMLTQFLAAVSQIELREFVTDLSDHHKEVMDALDMLFLGF